MSKIDDRLAALEARIAYLESKDPQLVEQAMIRRGKADAERRMREDTERQRREVEREQAEREARRKEFAATLRGSDFLTLTVRPECGRRVVATREVEIAIPGCGVNTLFVADRATLTSLLERDDKLRDALDSGLIVARQSTSDDHREWRRRQS